MFPSTSDTTSESQAEPNASQGETVEGEARAAQRIDELAQLVEAYNQVTVNLQSSHETLTAEVKRLQTQLASANAALQRSKRLAALGEMAAGIAHEVRNPLASIHLYADMLRSDLADRPEQQDLARHIATAVRGLDAIVSDVLSFSREVQVRPAQVVADELFERALDAVRPMLEAHRISVVIHGKATLLRVDPELMQQALVNLFRNSADAMPTGGTLTLTAEADEAAHQIVVADTGPGIGDKDVDRIFNPFFTTRATGTGLGLAIVHRIVDAHGGSIAVRNESLAGGESGGAAFTLCLPAQSTEGEDA